MGPQALLIHFTAEPPAALFDGAGSNERLARLKEFYRGVKHNLANRLDGEPVEIADLGAMGALIIRGAPDALARLCRPGGPLDGVAGIDVVEDTTFVATSSSVGPIHQVADADESRLPKRPDSASGGLATVRPLGRRIR
jgi:hypothetical protein